MSRAPRSSRFPLTLEGLGGPPRSAGAQPLRPQAPLHHAAQGAARQLAPQGLGLDSPAVRERMVQRLLAQGPLAESVRGALLRVPRHLFVDSALANQAYEDTALPIGHGQTISKPSVVARMLGLLTQTPAVAARGHLGRVLEIGGGCGYQAALLATLARQVISIERIGPLAHGARQRLQLGGWTNVRVMHADGRLGHAPSAPFDAIIAAAGGDDLPPAWLDQLAPGGRLLAPCTQAGRHQALVMVDRDERGYTRQTLDAVHFVPLKSGAE